MQVTIDHFLGIFPVFNDDSIYPANRIQLWLDVAGVQISYDHWRKLAPLAICLWTAHYLTLDKQEEDAANAGSTPGLADGVIRSVSTGSVSTGYDTTATTYKDDSHWNKTTYGTRFRELERRVGAVPTYFAPPGVGPNFNTGPIYGVSNGY